MAYYPILNPPENIIGGFVEKSAGNYFEYQSNPEKGMFCSGYPHKVWVTSPIKGLDSGWRYARILKTVAYVVIDEDQYGQPVIEKWHIKNHRIWGTNDV